MKKLLIVLCVLAPAWVLTLLLPGSAATPAEAVTSATSNFVLEADGFVGESTAAKFSKAIDVLAWSWGASNDGRTANFQNISMTKYIDRTSPQFMEYVGTGQEIPKAKLHVIRSGGDQQEYLTFCFTNLRATSVSSGGSVGEDRLTENVSFSYETIVQRYRPQKADGSLDAGIHFKFDLKNNKTF